MAKGEADWNAGLTINAMPLNSAICEPQSSARLKAGASTIRGWATASERAIKRVDVSLDGGRSWRQASLEQDSAHPHAWTLWRLEAVLAEGGHELVVRAFDSALQTQPDKPDDTWNYPGYLAAHSHRIHVFVAQAALRQERTLATLPRQARQQAAEVAYKPLARSALTHNVKRE